MSEKVIISGNGKQININTLMGLDGRIVIDEFNLDEEKIGTLEMFIPKSEEQWHDEYYGVNLERLMPSDHNVCCTKKHKRNNKDKEYIKRKRQ
jgi:hypothetical protein